MKKVIVSAIMAFALMTSISVMAQDDKKKDADTKAKTETCCQKEADKAKQEECTKKEADKANKKECCSKKDEPKK